MIRLSLAGTLLLVACTAAPAPPAARPPSFSGQARDPGPPDASLEPPEPAAAPAQPGGLLAAVMPPGERRAPFLELEARGPRSGRLPSGWYNPMPGGLLSGYAADTGLDIAGFKKDVFAVGAGTLDYAEAGHTRWTSRNDSPFTIRLKLDQPVAWRDRRITHVYYGHLSSLEISVREGQTPGVHVEGGQRLGVSGWANGSPHLHLGLLLDDHTEQDSWSYILDEREVRQALGVGKNGQRLEGVSARLHRKKGRGWAALRRWFCAGPGRA